MNNQTPFEEKQAFFSSLYDKVGKDKIGKLFAQACVDQKFVVQPDEFLYSEAMQIPLIQCAADAHFEAQKQLFLSFYRDNLHLFPKDVVVKVFATLGGKDIEPEVVNKMVIAANELKLN